MSGLVYLARFFVAVPPMPLLMLGALAVATAISAVMISFEPARASGALTPILLLQLFACSSGFDVPARRGHYDLLLTRGGTRRRVVFGHWLASAVPGCVCWLLLAVVCSLAGGGNERRALFNAGTVSAMSLVSTIPWATTVRLPRFSGAIGWLLIGTIVSVAAPGVLTLDVGTLNGTLDGTLGETWRGWIQTASAVLVNPRLLVGAALGLQEALVVLPALLVAGGALAVAFRSVNRRDIPLEAAQ